MRKINYSIEPQRLSLLLIISLMLLWNILAGYFGSSILLFIVILILGIFFASFRFKLSFYEDHLNYQVFLFRKKVYKKIIYPEDISQLNFIRIGWAKKAAVIKMKKGRNIRLAVLKPEEAYDHLIDFGERHRLDIFKSKDYLTLEKLERNRVARDA